MKSGDVSEVFDSVGVFRVVELPLIFDDAVRFVLAFVVIFVNKRITPIGEGIFADDIDEIIGEFFAESAVDVVGVEIVENPIQFVEGFDSFTDRKILAFDVVDALIVLLFVVMDFGEDGHSCSSSGCLIGTGFASI